MSSCEDALDSRGSPRAWRHGCLGIQESKRAVRTKEPPLANRAWTRCYFGNERLAGMHAADVIQGSLDPRQAVLHGLSLLPAQAGYYTLYATNHGGRESIEAFDIDGRAPHRRPPGWAAC